MSDELPVITLVFEADQDEESARIIAESVCGLYLPPGSVVLGVYSRHVDSPGQWHAEVAMPNAPGAALAVLYAAAPPRLIADALLLATVIAHGLANEPWLNRWREEHADTVQWLRDNARSPSFPWDP